MLVKKYLSAKIQHEVNCKEAEARKLYSIVDPVLRTIA
jgi:hypothetical protein